MAYTIRAADSEFPQLGLASLRNWRAWCVYVGGSAAHVWTRAEVASLAGSGIAGALPIVVPPQAWPWIMPEDVVMASLVREAEAWGVPKGSPLAVDIEEKWAERMGSQLPNVLGLFAGAARAAGFSPVVYGSFRTLAAAPQGGISGWLAEWPEPAGSSPEVTPEIPEGVFAWQYAGNVFDGRIDLDLIRVPCVLMATDFTNPTGLVQFDTEGSEAPVPVLNPKKPIAAKPETFDDAPEPISTAKAAGIPDVAPETSAAPQAAAGTPAGPEAEDDQVSTDPGDGPHAAARAAFVTALRKWAIGDRSGLGDVACALADLLETVG